MGCVDARIGGSNAVASPTTVETATSRSKRHCSKSPTAQHFEGVYRSIFNPTLMAALITLCIKEARWLMHPVLITKF